MIFLPTLVVIFLAIFTRKIIPSLFIGIWVGATLLNGNNPIMGFLKVFESFIIPSLSKEWNATVILYGGAFGGLISLLQRTGGFFAFAKVFTKKVKTAFSAQLVTMVLGVLTFFDDYFSGLIVGIVMRPITDKLKVAREKLAFIVDSTAAPVCLLVPLSTWVIYIVGLIGQESSDASSSYLTYLKTIPLNLYSIMTLFCTLLFIIKKEQIGSMRKKEKEANLLNEISAVESKNSKISKDLETISFETDKNRSILNLVVPFLAFFVSFILVFLYSGGYFETHDFTLAFANAKGAYSILIGSFVAGMSALLLGIIKKHFTFSIGFNYYIDGAKSMIRTYLILLLAWSMSGVIKQMHVADFIASFLKDNLSIVLLPALLFFVSSIIAFATGTSYGTFAILVPLALSFSKKLNIPFEYVLAPVLSGGVFGDHSSFISDTTILTCSSTQCDLMSHFITQLPYTLLIALSSIVGFLVFGVFQGILVSLSAAIISFVFFVFIIEKIRALKKRVFLVKN
ncbi:MAG: hypothetical protein JXA94_06410 [Parachlamydiales bacterium]|nr:hypothetical protein [Parachlamydiales bacterium]